MKDYRSTLSESETRVIDDKLKSMKKLNDEIQAQNAHKLQKLLSKNDQSKMNRT